MAPGDVIEIPYPFVHDRFETFDEDGPVMVPTWKPGCRYEPYGSEDVEAVADAVGTQILTIVDVHKPGRYPTRVFYTRQWRAPDGRLFGNRCLRITTAEKVRRLIKGYKQEYRLV
jgi:hypothetical protein